MTVTTDIESPAVQRAQPRPIPAPRRQPMYHVVLLDDDDHTYAYVIEMLMRVFGHPGEKAYRMACEVDTTGRVILLTTTLEHAELKRDQIHAYGPDLLLSRSKGSMSAVLEPAI